MLKVVFDTNVFLRALINPYGINSKLIASSDKYRLLLSRDIIDEILDRFHTHRFGSKQPLMKPELTSHRALRRRILPRLGHVRDHPLEDLALGAVQN